MVLKLVLAIYSLSLFTISPLQAKEYMFFSVESFKMKQESITPPMALVGDIAAKSMLLIFGSEEIEIVAPEGELFYAKVRMDENRITFKKDYISFSTDMGLQNPLKNITEFDVLNSNIEFSEDGIIINSSKMNLSMETANFGLKNVSLVCENEDDYSTEIDEVCLQKAQLRKLDSALNVNNEDAFLFIKDLNSKLPLELEFNLKELTVNPKDIQAQTHTISGKIAETNYILDQADFKCFKFDDITTFDPEKLLAGCFEESLAKINNFNLIKNDLEANIKDANMLIEKEKFHLISDSATFVSGSEGNKKDTTTIESLNIECDKLITPIKKFSLERSMILEGCIKHTNLTVAKVHVDEGKALSFLKDVDYIHYDQVEKESKKLFNFMNFKKVSIKSDNGRFILRAKAKFLFRVPVKITGMLNFNKDSNILEMTIDKASVLGIPSRKLAFYLVKKFVANDDIQVNENTINIQF